MCVVTGVVFWVERTATRYTRSGSWAASDVYRGQLLQMCTFVLEFTIKGAPKPPASSHVLPGVPAEQLVAANVVQRAALGVEDPPPIHISEPTRQEETSYAVYCLKKKKKIKTSTSQRERQKTRTQTSERKKKHK